jgi:hypothetical protein
MSEFNTSQFNVTRFNEGEEIEVTNYTPNPSRTLKLLNERIVSVDAINRIIEVSA